MESIKNVVGLDTRTINGVTVTLSKEWLTKAVFIVRCSDWDYSASCAIESEARKLFDCEIERLAGK